MEKFKDFIETYTALTSTEWQFIRNAFQRKVFEKNEIILDAGDVCRNFYFMESGLIRYYYNVDGNEVTKTFTISPYCFTSRISFRNQSPSKECIQAIERTITWQTSFDNFKKLEELISWNVFIKKLVNEVEEFSEDFHLEVRTMTAETRYQKLLENYPDDLIRKIPLKLLSSFLDIAPQSLSRIRKKLRNNDEN